MENLVKDTQAELKVQISRIEHGETFPMHIRNFSNLAELERFVEVTGYEVEVLEIIAYRIEAPKAPWLGQTTARNLKDAMRIKLSWKLNHNAHAVIKESNGFIVSELEQQQALLEILSN